MNIIIPINGRNERLGCLFSTPKHLLLYQGHPALYWSLHNLVNAFSFAKITILANKIYIDEIRQINQYYDVRVIQVESTNSQVETLLQFTKTLEGDAMFVDCDIIPMRINFPMSNLVYVFDNVRKDKQYSNFVTQEDLITGCNEKDMLYKWAGAGVYYFDHVKIFNECALGEKNISGVIMNAIKQGYEFKRSEER